MKNYQLDIRLLSDTIIGSGTGFGAAIDQDVVLNELGLPYIPGKRIKGCLRDSATEILDLLSLSETTGIFDLSKEQITKKNNAYRLIKNIFGVPGSLNSTKLIMHNLYLPKAVELDNWLAYLSHEYPAIYNSEAVTDQFTSIRQQTSLEESGLAKRNSLRTFRLIDKDLSFHGNIEADISDEELALLALAAKNLKSLGTKRTRGYGSVACTISELDENIKPFAEKLQEVYNA